MKNKNKEQKRRGELAAKSRVESFQYQVQWGVRQRIENEDFQFVEKLSAEMSRFVGAGLADDMLRLKEVKEDLKAKTGIEPELVQGMLCESLVAYCLGIVPNLPTGTDGNFARQDLNSTIMTDWYFNTEARAKVVEFLKESGIEMGAYLGQPMAKIAKMRVVLRRTIKKSDDV